MEGAVSGDGGGKNVEGSGTGSEADGVGGVVPGKVGSCSSRRLPAAA